MMAIINELKFPYTTPIVEVGGLLSKAWQEILKFLKIIIDPLGIERSYNLLNNIAVPTKINGLRFSPRHIASFCDYVTVRTTSTNERVSAGTFRVIYRSKAQTFTLTPDPNAGPDVTGVTLSINNDGEVFYVSTNLAGIQETFKISIRQSYLLTGNLIV